MNYHRMSLEEKIGQLFIVGFPGTEMNEHLEELITRWHVGGIILFRHNCPGPDKTARLVEEIQGRAAYPLLICVDQEGGKVQRVEGITHFPGNMTLGATHSPELAEKMGRETGRQLRSLGINWNLAPVLDVNSNPANPVIGSRSFGSDPGLVSSLGCSYIRGMQEEGVMACAKHFPGHGDTEEDSHHTLPVIRQGLQELEKTALPPFRKAIAAGVGSIMTAHIHFPALTGSRPFPATLSSRVLTDLLRQNLGFKGLVVSDCLEMEAIAGTLGTPAGALAAITAGADMVIVSHQEQSQKAAMRGVREAILKGEISINLLEDRLERICRSKRSFQREQSAHQQLTSRGDLLAREIAEKGVTLFRDPGGLLPLPEPFKVMIRGEEGDRLIEALGANGEGVEKIPLEQADSVSASTPLIFLACGLGQDPEQQQALQGLEARGVPLIFIALTDPYDLRFSGPDTTSLTAYDASPFNLEACARVLRGEVQARGKIPIQLGQLFSSGGD